MRDIAILCILLGCIRLAFQRPWLGALALAVFGYMHPQSYASGFMHDFPAYKVLFAAVVAATLISKEWRPLPRDWRLLALGLLWGYFLFTTYLAKAPWAAWPRFWEVSKAFLSAGLLLVLIDTREKLRYLIIVIAASVALVTLKGGYWAVMTGFADRVYGPPDSQYHDNNLFAVAVVMNIPLLILWLRETRQHALRYVLMAMIGLSAAAALSSWSRGGLISLAVTALVLLWCSKRKHLAIPLLAAGVALLFFNLPDRWFERMGTIASYERDASALSRLGVWEVGIKHALVFPFTGVGLDGWQYATVTIDWHSSYVEMMAEHGFVAFGIWCLLLFGTIFSLARLGRLAVRSPESAWIRDYGQMLGASLVAYATGSLFLGLSYWDIMYHILILSVLLSELAQKTNLRAAEGISTGREAVGGADG